MKRFENVKCDYTGGGIYVYSALFNGEVWLYGGLDNYFGSYDVPGQVVEEDFGCDYDAHWKKPSVPYPTWNDILGSLRETYGDDPQVDYMELSLRRSNPDMNARCIEDDDGTDPKGDKPMSKEELVDKLTDRLIDPWTDCPEDYEDSEPIDLATATSLLEDLKRDDQEMDDPDYCVPEGTTPELLMEVYNCILRKNQHSLLVKRFAEYLTENEMVCEYDQYRCEYDTNSVEVYPSCWLFDEYDANDFPFQLGDYKADLAYIFKLGQNSAKTFNADKEYMWFNREAFRIETTDTPYHDGIIDAEKFAEYILGPDGSECLDYFLGSLMDDNEIQEVFRCSEAEVRSRYFPC